MGILRTATNLSQKEKKMLVDYMENLPLDMKTLVKTRINTNDFDMSFFNRSERYLHIYCTITRFLDKSRVHVTEVNKWDQSDYQKEYVSLLEWFNRRYHELGANFVSIINMPAYDEPTLLHIETKLAEFINSIQDEELKKSLACDIHQVLMPYFYHVYDFYSGIRMKESFQNLGIPSVHRHIYNIFKMFNHSVFLSSGTLIQNDAAIILYVYFKELGIVNEIDKYHLFDRFEYFMKYYNHLSDDIIDGIKSNLDTLVNSKTSIVDAIHGLMQTKALVKNIKDEDSDIELDNGDRVIKTENFIFFLENASLWNYDELNEVGKCLKVLTPPEICHYLDNATTDTIDYHLKENDIGHISNLEGLFFGTAYDAFSHEMYYICWYEGDFYLLFKNWNNGRTVYGISAHTIKDDNGNMSRKIFELTESKAYSYVFKSEI